MEGDAMLNVARWITRSRVNGPGERFVLWLQGCSLRCAGCWNPDTWSHASRRLLRGSEVLAEVPEDVEGVTFTGGEPFEQDEALVPLLDGVRARGLSVMIFTGHEFEEISREASRAVLARCDVLVTGRYEAERRSLDLPWRGSRNQRVHFLTGRYGESDLPTHAETEVHLAADGSVEVTGFPEDEFLPLGYAVRARSPQRTA